MEIFNDILNAVQQESIDGEVYNTRIAQRCNMSYDKMTRYIEALKKKNLIQNFPLTITDKGKRFLQDYEKIKDFQVKMKIEYLTEEEEYIA